MPTASERFRGGVLPILLVSVLWGAVGLVSTLAPAAASTSALSAASILLGGALLFATAPGALGLIRAESWRSRALLCVGSVTVLSYSQAFYPAVRLLGVAPVTVITLGSAPLFAGGLARYVEHRPLPPRWTACAPLAILGCALLVLGGPAHAAHVVAKGSQALGVVLALLPGLAYAITSTIAGRYITRGHDSRDVMGSMFGGAALLAVPVLALGGVGWLSTARGLAVTGYLGVVITYLCYHVMGRALRHTTATVATMFTLAEAAVGALLGVAVRGERLSTAGWAGLGLLALALTILSLPTGYPAANGTRITGSDT